MESRFDEFWADPANWRWGLLYLCPQDPRVVVPKRPRWAGYTLNFAHRSAIPVLLGGIALVLSPVTLIFVMDPPQVTYWVTGGIAITLSLLLTFCHRESSRSS